MENISSTPSLLNTGISAYCIFRIDNLKATFNLSQFNSQVSRHNSVSPFIELEQLGAIVSFVAIESKTLQLNLQYIDSRLPEIISHIVYYGHLNGIAEFRTLLAILMKRNPLNFNQGMGHPFYELKIKSFLTAIALGMTSQTVWGQVYDAIGEVIIVKNPGGYHLYNSRELHDYLFDNARLKQVATKNEELIKLYKFGWFYEIGGEYFIKLNFQVGFT